MNFTNNYGLADEIVEAVVSRMGEYDRGRSDFSVTQIIDSPQVVQLGKKHADEITVDVHDLLEAWQGHLLHDALEKEETSYRLAYDFGGRVLSGAFDYYKDGLLKDYKRTSVWSIIYGSTLKKWEEQLNCYAHLLRQHGKEVDKCGIEVYLKDWSKQKAKFEGSYPNQRQYYIEMPLWEPQHASDFVYDRMMYHINCEDGKETCVCTPDDMWEKPTVYALMAEGRKSAIKLFDTLDELNSYCEDESNNSKLAKHINKLYVDTRLGERTRCAEWCDVSEFCPQWKEWSSHG